MTQHKLYSWIFGIAVPVFCLLAAAFTYTVLQAKGQDNLLMNSLSAPLFGLLALSVAIVYGNRVCSGRVHWAMCLLQACTATGASIMCMLAFLGFYNEEMVAKGGQWLMLYMGTQFGLLMLAYALFPLGFVLCKQCPRVRPAFVTSFLLFLLPFGSFTLRELGYI